MSNYKKAEMLLSNYNVLKVSRKNLQDEIEYLKGYDGMQGMSYDGISSSPTNEIKSSTERIAISNLEKIAKLQEKVDNIQRQITSIERALKTLDETEYLLIEGRYFLNLEWWEIAKRAGYSSSHGRAKRREAVEKIVLCIYGQ